MSNPGRHVVCHVCRRAVPHASLLGGRGLGEEVARLVAANVPGCR